MNLQEFAALKVGDRIENPATCSAGEVTEVTANGVHVVWGMRSAAERPFLYSVVGTAWMQWLKAERNAVQKETAGDAGIDRSSS